MQEALRRLEEMAGASKPPSLVALYKGSPAERKQLLAELEPRLQERGPPSEGGAELAEA